MKTKTPPLIAVVPAAGVGKRMKTNTPKQYLMLNGQTVLEHTVNKLLTHTQVEHVIVVIGKEDEYFADLSIANHPNISTVIGGAERVDSVLAGLKAIEQKVFQWVLVHDAARPCISHKDLTTLFDTVLTQQVGGLLGYSVRDTMKQVNPDSHLVSATLDRKSMWHALTPQMYQVAQLIDAIEQGLSKNIEVTDESSAIEAAGFPSLMVEGSSDNIKITRPDDLAFAEFILSKQQEE